MRSNNSKENKNKTNTAKSKDVNFSKDYVKKSLSELLRNSTANNPKSESTNKLNMIDLHTENINKLNKLHEDGLKSIESKNNYKSLINEEVLDITKLKNYFINLTNENMKKYNQLVEEEKTFTAKSMLEQNDKSRQIEDLIKETNVLRERSLLLESELQTKNV
jgi:hypothetical protein